MEPLLKNVTLHAKSLIVSNSLRPCGPPVASRALLSMRFARQECWSGLQVPSPGDFPNPGIEQADSFDDVDEP